MKKQAWLQDLARAHAGDPAALGWLSAALPAELRTALVSAVPRDRELVVTAASAAWAARLRFALAALEPQLRARQPDIVKLTVRVAPSGRASAR